MVLEIKKQFDRVLQYSQNLSGEPQTEELFTKWYKNKVETFEFLFGKDNYIIEFPIPINFNYSQKTLENKLDRFIVEVSHVSLDLAGFLTHFCKVFFNNIVTEDYMISTITGQTIKKGTKIIKAFKYFINNKDVLRMLQDKASKLIQDTKVNGTLCLSIHPLDFLSLSNNAHSWRSCHSLDGGYRAGNLAYMADQSTIICYLKSDKDTQISGFPSDIPWNSKKWRMLLFLSKSKDMMLAGRQYPFSFDIEALHKVSDLLETNQTFSQNCWTNWDNSYIDTFETNSLKFTLKDKYLVGHNEGLIPLQQLMFKETNTAPLFYNDLLYSSEYKKPYYKYTAHPWFGTPSSWHKGAPEVFPIGAHDIKCIICGENHIDHYTEQMICDKCSKNLQEKSYYCEICGAGLESDEIVIKEDDVILCAECAEERYRDCNICGRNVYVGDGILSADEEGFCCYDCLRKEDSDGC